MPLLSAQVGTTSRSAWICRIRLKTTKDDLAYIRNQCVLVLEAIFAIVKNYGNRLPDSRLGRPPKITPENANRLKAKTALARQDDID